MYPREQELGQDLRCRTVGILARGGVRLIPHPLISHFTRLPHFPHVEQNAPTLYTYTAEGYYTFH